MESLNGDEVARKETVINDEVRGWELASCNADGLFQHRVNNVVVDPPMLVVRFPLKELDQWQTKSKCGTQTVTVENEATIDEIEVPFGKLKAIKVTSKAKIEPSHREILTTTWFAPKIGVAKIVSKYVDAPDSEFTLVLEKYTVKKFLPE